ncbi:MAG: hypothetical protein RBR68_11375 [Tenuifilaceae bacterium]|nr:hypothetical protein [Tenuifilaceae bacterium]
MTNADNNKNKEYSREQLAIVANNHFKNKRSILMCDFLGTGIGAEYYLKNINNLNTIHLIENNKAKIKYLLNKPNVIKAVGYSILSKKHLDYFCFTGNIYKTGIIHDCDMYDFLNNKNYRFDILNLDFCAPYYYRENKTIVKSTVEILIQSFLNKSIKNGGLLFATFQTSGRCANIIKESIRNKQDISNNIAEIAKIFNYNIEEIYAYSYKSSRATRMLQLGYKVTSYE